MPGQWATPVTANACPKGTVLGSRRKTRRSPRIRPTRSAWRRIGTTAVAVNMAIGLLVALPAPAAYAQTSELTLSVISARTEPRAFGGAGVEQGRRRRTTFQFIINIDNTGTTGQRSPARRLRLFGERPRLPGLLPLALDRGGAARESHLRPGRPGRPHRWEQPRPCPTGATSSPCSPTATRSTVRTSPCRCRTRAWSRSSSSRTRCPTRRCGPRSSRTSLPPT